MADKQALNATFFAFRKRERGGVLLGATLTYLALAVLIGGAFVFLNAQAIMDYLSWAMNLNANMGNMKPGASMEAMMPPASVMAIFPGYLLIILLSYLLFAAYEAACLRWMIRGETEGLFGLSLGADTWRVYFTYWIWLFLLLAFYLVFAILAGGTMFALLTASGGDASGNGATAVVPVVLGFALVAGLAYFAVRFAPAAATSVARRKFSFFDAWTVSKGRFWALFGSFVLLFLMFLVLCIAAGAGMGFSVASLAASQLGQAGEPQTPGEVFAMFANPQLLIVLGAMYAVMIAAAMTLYVALFGINARAALAALEEGKIKAAA